MLGLRTGYNTILAIMALGLLTTVGFSNPSWGEDSIVTYDISCGAGCLDFSDGKNPFFSAIPGGTFVVTVAYLAPPPEDAFSGGRALSCDPVEFRIDTLTLDTEKGSIGVELGEQQELRMGGVSQIVHTVKDYYGADLPTFDMDMLAFRVRAAQTDSLCNLVASGLFYPEPTTLEPIAISLLPNADASLSEKR